MSAPKNLNDTNVFGIGSAEDIEKRVAAAKTVEAFKGVGQKPAVEIFRMEKFNAKKWRGKSGSFYDGDSYIVLVTKQEGKALKRDIYFWLGRDSSQDEQGTAALLTIALDDLLTQETGQMITQHREVQDQESDEFAKLFKNGISIMKGGIESGFNKVKPEAYKPKLLQIKGKNLIRVTEVPLSGNSLNSGDVFVLDGGENIWRWCGAQSSRAEQYTGMTVANNLKTDRSGKPSIIDVDESGDDAFWKAIGGKTKVKSASEGGDDKESQKKKPNQLFMLSDASGKLEFKKVSEGVLKKSSLDTNEVFIVDMDSTVYVWVGKGASKGERKYSMIYALNYLQKREAQIVRVGEGVEPNFFLGFFV